MQSKTETSPVSQEEIIKRKARNRRTRWLTTTEDRLISLEVGHSDNIKPLDNKAEASITNLLSRNTTGMKFTVERMEKNVLKITRTL